MIARHVTERILASLRDTPVVYIVGARQTGKTTLARYIAERYHPAEYLSLDAATTYAAATDDPEGFISALRGPVVIDEVQRVPALLLAIKAAVDRRRTPGRFLLTGSAGPLSLPKVSESLAGRVEIHTLCPFSRGEIGGRREEFIDALFASRFCRPLAEEVSETDLFRSIVVGGYPEATRRRGAGRRQAWFESYIATILGRDVRDLSAIERIADLPRLLAFLASRVASLLNYAEIARWLGIPQTTVKRHLALLGAVFLVKLVPAWSSNIGKRLVKAPKLHLTDTGLAAHLLGLDARRLARDRTLAGKLFESFVVLEVLKGLGWSKTRARPYHFRTESGAEVDLVLEDARGRVSGIEVKLAASVRAEDFRGLRALAEAAREAFVRGVLLYLGSEVVPFGREFFAMPVTSLWARWKP